MPSRIRTIKRAPCSSRFSNFSPVTNWLASHWKCYIEKIANIWLASPTGANSQMKLMFTNSSRTSRPRALLLALSCASLFISALLPHSALANQSPHKKSSSPQPDKIDPHFQETQSLLQQGRFDEARQQIQTQLAKDPKSVEGFNLLGIVCVSQKDFPSALEA